MDTYEEKKQIWEKSHWLRQTIEDIGVRPDACGFCGFTELEDELIDDPMAQGWRCKGCRTQIQAVAFFMGRNNAKKEFKLKDYK